MAEKQTQAPHKPGRSRVAHTPGYKGPEFTAPILGQSYVCPLT